MTRRCCSMPRSSGRWPSPSRPPPWTTSRRTTPGWELARRPDGARIDLLSVTAAGITFQNPILLAAGTAAYGRELAGIVDLDALGGLVTKAVSIAPRAGAPAPRVAEFDGGMINAVGL